MAEVTLTDREQEVLDLHDSGKRNVEIAEMLGIAAGTVSNALTKALRKLDREGDIGGNGPSGTTRSASVANDPEEMFKREGAKVLRRAQDAVDAVDNFPTDFDEWLDENRERMEKQYDSDRERLTSQVVSAQEAAEKWTAFAEPLGIDLNEVLAASQQPEAAADDDDADEEEPTA